MKADLINDILNRTPAFTVSKWVLERVPHVFNSDSDNYIEWKEQLSEAIEVDSKAIAFTGSSCVGVSLNPFKNFKDFDAASDIDIAIISNYYFDTAWHFLRNIGTRYLRLKYDEKMAVNEHRTRLIYHATIATDKIVHLLPFGINWLNAMAKMAEFAPTIDREINFRIYRDYEALKSYQKIGITKLKDQLLKPLQHG